MTFPFPLGMCVGKTVIFICGTYVSFSQCNVQRYTISITHFCLILKMTLPGQTRAGKLYSVPKIRRNKSVKLSYHLQFKRKKSHAVLKILSLVLNWASINFRIAFIKIPSKFTSQKL